MDNFQIDITCEGKEKLIKAMALAFYRVQSIQHYVIREAEPEFIDADKPYMNRPAKPLRLVFFRYPPDSGQSNALPFKLDSEGAGDFAFRWLQEAAYPREPDHDGHNKKGWRLYNEAWGHVDSDYRAFVAVTPTWAMYGK